MTASARGTPSFAPVPTQNTAPVHEFRCLYTHDAHKKAKKWHDGSLRFHTFNRRVMVYDDGKNFIGDLHYRQDEEFDEGIELRLDRGILVEVGERLGETQTDLTPLLDRKKDEASPQPAKNIRLVAAASQSISKPLSQILGSQSRMGRARPIISPYQQLRQALVPVQSTESSMPPPPKRQKVSQMGQENVFPLPKVAAQAIDRPEKTSVPNLSPQTEFGRPAPTKESQVDFQEVLDLSSDEDIAKTAQEMTSVSTKAAKSDDQSRTKAKHSDDGSIRKVKAARDMSAVRSRISEASTDNPRGDSSSKLLQRQLHASTEAAARISGQPASSRSSVSEHNASSKSGFTQLMLRPQKPRRKLMYRALLPSLRGKERTLGRASPQASVEDGSDVLTNDDNSSTENRLSSEQRPMDEPIDVPLCPLFVPQGNDKSPSRSSRSGYVDLEEQPDASLDHPKLDIPSPKDDSVTRPNRSCVVSPTEPRRTETILPPSLVHSKPTQMRPLLHATFHSPQRTMCCTPQSRPFRRVRSENDASVLDEEFPDLDPFSTPPPSFLAQAQASPPRPSRSPTKAPAKFRRTASDSVVIEESDETVTGYSIQPIREK